MFFLFNMIIYMVLGGLSVSALIAMAAPVDLAQGRSFPLTGFICLILLGLYGLAVLIPSLAVQVRRFHDQDKSGWFILLGLIPYLGGLVLLIFMCLEGTRGRNRFGADPRDPYGADVFG